jgi:glycerate 2-kinase
MNLRQYARTLFQRTMQSIDVSAAIRTNLTHVQNGLSVAGRTFSLQDFDSILLVALGKAAAEMSHATAQILEGLPVCGLVVSGRVEADRDARLSYRTGGHPLPTLESREAAKAVLALLATATERTLVLFLISGGASAMCELPLQSSISIQETSALYETLLHSGLPITEMNCVRKHFSAVKGGRLAKAAGRATQITLIISDVPRNLLDVVASGPTLPDTSTAEECRQILTGEGLLCHLPPNIVSFFNDPLLPDTVKSWDSCFSRSEMQCLLSEDALLEQASEIAVADGFQVMIDMTCDDWPVEEAANYLLKRVSHLEGNGGRHCLISGGEISVRLPEQVGVGGRNQQFALTCASLLHHQHRNVTVLSAGSDGLDGNSPAAGAIIDGQTWTEAQERGLDPEKHLRHFDSFPLLDAIGASIVSGPTGNNLRDIRIMLVEA